MLKSSNTKHTPSVDTKFEGLRCIRQKGRNAAEPSKTVYPQQSLADDTSDKIC